MVLTQVIEMSDNADIEIESELTKELLKRGLSPIELTEFDQWVNDATRKDINKIVNKNKNVFGLQFWTWRVLEGEELIDAKNFSVDVILKEEDRGKVDELINQYESKEIDSVEIVNRIFDMAVYVAIWV